MKRIMPRFWKEFHCIAGACTDSCCIGWEIDIDDETAAVYEAQEGAFGERLKENIVCGTEARHFALKEKERCAFLNEQNLCDIYIHMGESCLCGICREHPRFYEWFGDRVEAGLGLCCEEVCRLLLADEAPIAFVSEDDGEPDEEFEGDADLLELLEPVREEVYALLQDREKPFVQRLAQVLSLLERVQDEMDGFPPADACGPQLLPEDEQLTALCRELEPIDAKWTELVRRMAEETRCAQVEAPDWTYEHAVVYLTYRWLLKAAFDGDVLGKGRLIVTFVRLMQMLLDKGLVKDAQEALRVLSKEIEYSAENTERVQGFCWEE